MMPLVSTPCNLDIYSLVRFEPRVEFTSGDILYK